MDDKFSGFIGSRVEIHFNDEAGTSMSNCEFRGQNIFGLFVAVARSAGVEIQFVPWPALHHFSLDAAALEANTAGQQQGQAAKWIEAARIMNLD